MATSTVDTGFIYSGINQTEVGDKTCMDVDLSNIYWAFLLYSLLLHHNKIVAGTIIKSCYNNYKAQLLLQK